MKTLIVYGTRYGATAGTSEEIARLLRQDGLDVKVANLKEERIDDVSGYDLVIVGSGISMGMWSNEAEDFLRRFSHQLKGKKHALFVSSMKTLSEREGKTEQVANARRTALEDKVEKYGLKPISLGLFGGVIDFNKMSFLARAGMSLAKPEFERNGFVEAPPGVYDLRNWDEIVNWAKDLAATVNGAPIAVYAGAGTGGDQ